MAIIKDVTHGQLEEVKRLAGDAGIGRDRFQTAVLDSGALANLLRRVGNWFLPPPGGRIHILPSILVHEDEDWIKALEAAGPNTPAEHYIRKIGRFYPTTGKGEVRKDFILLNRPGWSMNQFLAWGKAKGLCGTTARDVFAIGRDRPDLNRELNIDPLWVHDTDDRLILGGDVDTTGVLAVLWRGAERMVGYCWTKYLYIKTDNDTGYWCLFVRE